MHNHNAVAIAGGEMPKVALVGTPNVGKSVIFNLLSGVYVTVSNYPGTTVEVTRGNALIGDKKYQVLDTPGVNGLVPMSEDEAVTRNILLRALPEAVVEVCDAKNLKRALFIALQLAEMEAPMVLDLNMWDEAKEARVNIDIPKLAKLLGIKVVPTIAIQRQGITELIDAIPQAKKCALKVSYDARIEEAICKISSLLPNEKTPARAVALMLLAGDTTLKDWLLDSVSAENLDKIEEEIHRVQTNFSRPLGYVINQQRQLAIDGILKYVQKVEEHRPNKFAEKLGALAVHPLWGVPIMLGVLYIAWWFVGYLGARVAVDFLEQTFFGAWVVPFISKIIHNASPWDFITRMLVGQYGVISMACTYALAIILPIMITFFLFFGFLEDSGYIPRLAVMLNKIFKAIGLNGKAVLPMVLGLGCDTMATMTTRVLETRRERLIVTLLLTLGVPCSAQLGVVWGMLGSPFSPMGSIWLAIVIGTIMLVGYVAGKILPGRRTDFLLEVPPVRVPKISNIVTKTVGRIKWYLKEAVPLFIIGTFILFILAETGLLVRLQSALSPVVTGLLGMPKETTQAFILGFLRRDYGAAGFFQMQKAGILTANQILVGLVVITLFVPCIAQFFVTIKEFGMKIAVGMTAFVLLFAFGIGAVLNIFLKLTGIVL